MSVFDRLYNTQTKSSSQKKHTNNGQAVAASFSKTLRSQDNVVNTTPEKRNTRKTKQALRPLTGNQKDLEVAARPVATATSNSMTCILLGSTRTDPDTFCPISVPGLSTTMTNYNQGTLSEPTFAGRIIEAMFHRDYEGDSTQWIVDPVQVTRVTEDQDGTVFDVHKNATCNFQEVSSTASAKARIRFGKESNVVRVEAYSYTKWDRN
jgi:hypothetical protein